MVKTSTSSESSSSSSSSSTTDKNKTDSDKKTKSGINKEACKKYGITLREPPEDPVEPYSRYASDDTIYGFITKTTHDQDGTEIEIKDWGYCLEENRIELGFQNMLRSEIMEEVIKTYGLVPIVDFTDLEDDVTSWDNGIHKSKSSDTTNGESSGSASIDEAVQKAIKGLTDPLDKAKAVDKAFKDWIIYEYYYDCKWANDLEGAWRHQWLNCADGANVLSAMFGKAGLQRCIVYTDSHYIVRVTINGHDYYTDNAANTGQHTSRPFGEVYGGTSGTDMGTHLSY